MRATDASKPQKAYTPETDIRKKSCPCSNHVNFAVGNQQSRVSQLLLSANVEPINKGAIKKTAVDQKPNLPFRFFCIGKSYAKDTPVAGFRRRSLSSRDASRLLRNRG